MRSVERIPDDARPGSTSRSRPHEEERLVERCIQVNVPTQDEMSEIEPSSRLYEKNGALYMTVSALRGVDEAHPSTTPIGFVLAGNRLVTIRYATPKPVRTFENHARREPELVRDGPTALVRLLDAIIDRLADEIEKRQRRDGATVAADFPGAAGRAPDSRGEADRASDEHRPHADAA